MERNHALENLRVSYQASRLDIDDCHSDPLHQFDLWLEQAINSQCDEPNAFVLSTTDQGRPRSRVVLLKGVHKGKLVFYTNYLSPKGLEMEKQPLVAMNFLWLPLQRQIRIEGQVSKTSPEQSDDYFQKRPRGSQLGAIASPQGQRVPDRSTLEKMFQETEEKFRGMAILPRPENWGGYQVEPNLIEFWQGRPNRLHDRICYFKKGDSWDRFRLGP
jgi:pyridoxamine 5'-phosphate oxidase